MTFLDFFAGIGGFRRGLELAGHKCLGFCECDKYAVASYTSMHLITEDQRKHLATMSLRDRQKEILKDGYRNGEWYANDVRRLEAGSLPSADCWCFGFPCQDISKSGNHAGFRGDRSSLFFAITRVIRELSEEDRPRWLLIENVQNLLSIDRGFDFARLLIELDEIGYDVEWEVLNSKDFGVPQNRERVFIIGHFRGRSGFQVFPIQGSGEEDHLQEGLNKNSSISFCDFNIGDGLNITKNARPVGARYYKGQTQRPGESSAVAIRIREATQKGYSEAYEGDSINLEVPESDTRRGRVGKSIANTLDTGCNQGTMIQAGGDLINYAVPAEDGKTHIAIRRLTPKECFRLQGWTDDYFYKASFVNSDSQLYKQAGNGVTVNVVQAIGERME